ncbi:hypothetical protein [uncultured Alsobacter sp.]|uniref:hypothetical protein n=1 Tax=uncultured Alsobacter sp. TaxID=1748258 RepID=UPI0025E5118A|nr:hypothetical protein [uncultured Alsobacter sp.]
MVPTAKIASAVEPGGPAVRWRRWLRRATLGVVALPIAALALVAVIDPYDTGRPVATGLRGTPADSPRFAHVSRARDPRYEAAIFGNSHVQLLSPDRLKAATGLQTVSLTVPGSGVREKEALLAWFMRHRRQAPALLVFGVDEFECHGGSGLLQTNPFPFWLYDTATAPYLAGLFNTRTVGAAAERITLAARGRLSRPDDGYWDYEAGRTWTPPALAASRPAGAAGPVPARFAGVERLGAMLSAVPETTRVVLVRPPVHLSRHPEPASSAARVDEACRKALHAVVGRRPGTVLLDYRDGDPAWAAAELFWDDSHYRRPVAERIERDIARFARPSG